MSNLNVRKVLVDVLNASLKRQGLDDIRVMELCNKGDHALIEYERDGKVCVGVVMAEALLPEKLEHARN